MLFPTLEPSSLPIVVAQPDETHANIRASVLECNDRRKAYSTTSGLNEEEEEYSNIEKLQNMYKKQRNKGYSPITNFNSNVTLKRSEIIGIINQKYRYVDAELQCSISMHNLLHIHILKAQE